MAEEPRTCKLRLPWSESAHCIERSFSVLRQLQDDKVGAPSCFIAIALNVSFRDDSSDVSSVKGRYCIQIGVRGTHEVVAIIASLSEKPGNSFNYER